MSITEITESVVKLRPKLVQAAEMYGELLGELDPFSRDTLVREFKEALEKGVHRGKESTYAKK